MATVAPSACGRSSDACSGAEWSHPLFFSNRNIRWLDFARHDSMCIGCISASRRDGILRLPHLPTAADVGHLQSMPFRNLCWELE